MDEKVKDFLEKELPELCQEYSNEAEVAYNIAVTLAASDSFLPESFVNELMSRCLLEYDCDFIQMKLAYMSLFFGMGLVQIRCDCVPPIVIDDCLVMKMISHPGYSDGAAYEFSETNEFVEARRRIENMRLDITFAC